MQDIAVSALATVGDVLRDPAWLTKVHQQIGFLGKDKAKATGGTFRIWSKKSTSYRTVKLAAKFENDAKHVVIKPSPPGLWSMQEKGTRSHGIPKLFSTQGKKKKGKRKSLTIPGSPTGYADHAKVRGRRAQHRWTKVTQFVQENAAKVVDEEIQKILARSFNGG